MNQDIEILRILAKYDKEIEKLYNKLLYQLSKVSLNITKIREGAFFSFDDYPEIKEKVNEVLNSYTKEQQDIILSGINTAMIKSFKANEAKFGEFSRYTNQAIIDMRSTAKNAFIESRMKPEQGLSLSQKVWNYTQQGKAEFEAGMSEILEEGFLDGISAEELGRKLRNKLKHPDMVYKRYHLKKMTAQGKKDVVEWRRKVVDSEGKVRYVKEDLEKVGRGVYRSSRKNALRLAATEINMAYRYADYVRWNSEPFVVGVRIQLSENHTLNGKPFHDMCDDLVGVYPKTFRWAGWHPRCYSDDSEVLTNQGWKLFKDVQQSDLILSLNPGTKNVEWVTIRQQMNWHHKGDMIHYSNRSLDCLVTPEHEMVYLSKRTGKISRKDASEFKMSNGAFYRSCEYDANDSLSITIGDTSILFDLFCEFMGYWLSDGSTIRTVQIVIAQQDGDPNKQKIVECIEKMGFRVHTNNAKVEFYSKDLCQYLKQFGKCNTKFIPKEIKGASRRQIQIFLDAFISCDGYVKKPHSFVGSHGNVCVSKNPERIYFTTSKQLEADLGELILKIGKRPSFRINNKAGKVCHFKNGDYKTNYDCYSVTECQATTATVFDKSIEEYDGMVYDLELSKNHIMYIRRNGKCFWGSNCRCIATSILVSREEMEKISELPDDEYRNYRSPNLVKKMPKAYDEYVAKEKDRILDSMDRGTTPYWVRDNYKKGDIRKKFVWERIGKTKFKTQAQKDAIQKAWDERRKKNAILAAAEKRHAKRDAVAIQKAWDLRKEKYAKLMKTAQNVNMAAYGEAWVDRTNLKWLINKKKYHLLEAEYRKVAKELSLAKKRKKQLSALIPDVDSWSEQFSYDELKVVFDSVEKKLAQWSSLTLEQQQKKLSFEIVDYLGGNMGGVQQKYSTWKVSQAAYSSKLQKVNLQLYKESIKKDVASFITWTTNHPKATGVYKKVMDLVDMVSDDSVEIALIKQKFGDIKSHIKQLEKEAAQRAAKKYHSGTFSSVSGSAYTGGSPYTEVELAKIADYEQRISKQVAKGLKNLGALETIQDEYANYILSLSQKYYDKQAGLLSLKEIEKAEQALMSYLGRTPKNPNYIWGNVLGGEYHSMPNAREALAQMLNDVSSEELSLVTRFTNGMTFSNSYVLRHQSPYWKRIWENKMSMLNTADDVKEMIEIIGEYEDSINFILNKMHRYDGYVYRGLKNGGADEVLGQLQSAWNGGKAWENIAPASSSTSLRVAKSFDDGTDSSLILIIKNKSGVNIRPISEYNSEREIMLLKNRKYRVLKEPYKMGDVNIVELEEII